MLVVDYKDCLHGMNLQFCFEISLKNMIPYHPMRIGLWLTAVFSTALSLRLAGRWFGSDQWAILLIKDVAILRIFKPWWMLYKIGVI